MNRKKIIENPLLGILLVAVVLGGIYLLGEYRGKSVTRSIAKNHVMASGIVSKVEFRTKLGYVVRYSFEVNDQYYSSSVNGSKFTRVKNVLTGRSFPIIVSATDPSNNEMLILPEDFEKYHIPFPDSLGWVEEYLNK